MDLFNATPNYKLPVSVPDGWYIYWPNFFDQETANSLYEVLHEQTAWEQRSMNMYGKQLPFPRLTAWYGDPKATYAYSGNVFEPLPLTPVLQELFNQLHMEFPYRFNSVLLNLYRNGQDSMGWHADDEPELGRNPVIASLNLGQTRTFYLKHRLLNHRIKLDLQPGSLLIMGGAMQHHWIHQVPKSQQALKARINLTFRWNYPSSRTTVH